MIKDGFIKKYTRASEGCNATFDDGRIVTDQDVANFVFKHMRIRDMFCLGKIVSATLSAFAILSNEESTKEELDGDWKFKDL